MFGVSEKISTSYNWCTIDTPVFCTRRPLTVGLFNDHFHVWHQKFGPHRQPVLEHVIVNDDEKKVENRADQQFPCVCGEISCQGVCYEKLVSLWFFLDVCLQKKGKVLKFAERMLQDGKGNGYVLYELDVRKEKMKISKIQVPEQFLAETNTTICTAVTTDEQLVFIFGVGKKNPWVLDLVKNKLRPCKIGYPGGREYFSNQDTQKVVPWRKNNGVLQVTTMRSMEEEQVLTDGYIQKHFKEVMPVQLRQLICRWVERETLHVIDGKKHWFIEVDKVMCLLQ